MVSGVQPIRSNNRYLLFINCTYDITNECIIDTRDKDTYCAGRIHWPKNTVFVPPFHTANGCFFSSIIMRFKCCSHEATETRPSAMHASMASCVWLLLHAWYSSYHSWRSTRITRGCSLVQSTLPRLKRGRRLPTTQSYRAHGSPICQLYVGQYG